jgi:hypothetical protein
MSIQGLTYAITVTHGSTLIPAVILLLLYLDLYSFVYSCSFGVDTSFGWPLDAFVPAFVRSCIAYSGCYIYQACKPVAGFLVLVLVHVLLFYARLLAGRLHEDYIKWLTWLARATSIGALRIVSGSWPFRWPCIMYLSLVAVPTSVPWAIM